MEPRRALPLALLALAACGSETPPLPDASAGDWDLVITVLDALPADALGCYGYEREVSPRIDRFAADAVRFEEAFSAAAYTLASTASLFTGLDAGAHGVLGLKSNLLSLQHRTLAETLADAGFRTGGFSCNPHITPEGGFAQGFDTFRHYGRDRFDRHSVPDALLGDVMEWWEADADERRFLYLHLLPPHQPYDAPEPHGALFGADRTRQEEGSTPFLVELDAERSIRHPSPQAERIRARYDAGLHHADAWWGEFLDRIDALGASTTAVVVLLSDHGEAFGEHGRLLHGPTVFAEMTRVPLMVRWPGASPGSRSTPVGTRSLGATLLRLLGIQEEPLSPGGVFLEALFGTGGAPGPILSRSVGNHPVWALRDGPWSLIEHPHSGSTTLHDRRIDPGEMTDLSSREPARAAEMHSSLSRQLEEDRRLSRRLGVRGGAVSTHAEALRDLGYTGDD